MQQEKAPRPPYSQVTGRETPELAAELAPAFFQMEEHTVPHGKRMEHCTQKRVKNEENKR